MKASGLAAKGVEPGEKVGLFARSNFDFIVGCLAVWRMGGTVVPLAFPHRFAPKDIWMERALERATATGVDVLLASGVEETDGMEMPTLLTSDLKGSAGLFYPGPDADALALIQFTSGSTARPRGVALTHRTLATQFELFRQTLGGRRSHGHLVSWLPLFHDMGMVANVLMSMAMGVRATLMPPELFILDPGFWMLEISRNRATASSAPAFAYALAARAIEKGLPEPIDLSCWDRAASGSEAVNPKPVERFMRAASPLGFDPGNFSAGYGLAEATCIVTFVRSGEGLTADPVSREAVSRGEATPAGEGEPTSEFISCGKPIVGIELQIADGGGGFLDERQVGEVWIKGPTLMEGYHDEPEATAEVLRDGWLRTGDLGYLADGNLYITGRAKDVVIVRGQNFSPEDLERVVEDVGGTKWGCTVAVGVRREETESLVIGVETNLQDPLDLENLASSIRKRLISQVGLAAAEVVLLPPRTLPRTTSGKLQRRAFKDLYEKGGIDATEPLAKLRDGS